MRAAAGERTPALGRLALPAPVIALLAGGIVLEVGGYFSRVAGAPPAISRFASMDLPYSLPRLYISAIFAIAAVVAAVGAQRIPGRRMWWTAIAGVAALLAVVKAGSTVHKTVVVALDGYAQPVRALAITGAVAVLGLAWLSWLSRNERRDRRRILGSLGLYAGAAIGLSTVSTLLEEAAGRRSLVSAGGVFVEEVSELTAAVAFLVAVLMGVAPRLVLPTAWRLRRAADRHTLDAVEFPAQPALGPAHASR